MDARGLLAVAPGGGVACQHVPQPQRKKREQKKHLKQTYGFFFLFFTLVLLYEPAGNIFFWERSDASDICLRSSGRVGRRGDVAFFSYLNLCDETKGRRSLLPKSSSVWSHLFTLTGSRVLRFFPLRFFPGQDFF